MYPIQQTFMEPRNRLGQAGNRFLGSIKGLQIRALGIRDLRSQLIRDTVIHKVRIYKEYHSVSPLVGFGSLSTPLSPTSVPGLQFYTFFWNFDRNHTENDRYWKKNNFLPFAKCWKMYSFIRICILRLQKVLLWSKNFFFLKNINMGIKKTQNFMLMLLWFTFGGWREFPMVFQPLIPCPSRRNRF